MGMDSACNSTACVGNHDSVLNKKYDCITKNREEVNQLYKCEKHKEGCAECISHGICTKSSAKEYRNFVKRADNEYRASFWCKKRKKICELKKCEEYDVCRKSEKKNYMEWLRNIHDKDKNLQKGI